MDNRLSQMGTLARKIGGNVSTSGNIKKVEVKTSQPAKPPKSTPQPEKKKCNCGRRKTSK